MTPPKKKTSRYNQSSLEEAVYLINNNKISLSKASATYKIPKGTLHNKIHGKTPLMCKKGPGNIFDDADERKIERWIINMAKVGYPVHTTDVLETVGKISALRGLNKKPGRKWMTLFLKRHPNISKRHAEIISKTRAAVTEHAIRNWFSDLCQFLIDENAYDLIEDPDRIFNLDETGVQLCPKSGVVLGPKNFRSLYVIASGQEKQSVTVLFNFSASGKIVPPFIVYPLKRISREVVQSVPDDWALGRSDSGWMTGETFLQYVKEIYFPWLKQQNIKFPVLLLVDGHKSHINMELHSFCTDNKIILYCLYPNTTHIIQPCDVGIFGPLKKAWRNACRLHSNQGNCQLTKSNFAKLFSETFKSSVKQSHIHNAFRACGIFPFNADAVDYSKCMTKRQEEIENEISLDEYKTALTVIEKTLKTNIINRYNFYRRNNKPLKSSLYKFWKKCKNKVENLVKSQSSIIDDSLINKTDDSRSQVFEISELPITYEPMQELQQPYLVSSEFYPEDLSINTNNIIEDILNVSIEEVDQLIDNALIDINEPVRSSFSDHLEFQKPKSTDKINNLTDASLSWTLPNIASTPIPKLVIPMPWYTSLNEDINVNVPINIPEEITQNHGKSSIQNANFQNNSHDIVTIETQTDNDLQYNNSELKEYHIQHDNKDIHETKTQQDASIHPIHDQEFNSDIQEDIHIIQNDDQVLHNAIEPQPGCSKQTESDITELLILPERKKATKRKLNKSPVPLAITSKKFKEYLEKKDLEKTKKEQDILERKIRRQQIKIEKENLATEKKNKSKKPTTKLKTKEKPVKTTSPKAIKDILVDIKDINIGSNSHVIVEFETNKRNRYYVAEVLKKNIKNNLVQIKCFRKKYSKLDDFIYFVEPSTVDLAEVSASAIKHILPLPRVGRRGMITFDEPLYDLSTCE